MKRRDFLTYSLLTGGSSLLLPLVTACQKGNKISSSMPIEGGAKVEEMKADIVVVGGGMGGCATALAACRNGMNVILTEETDWIGGQVSQQGVPPGLSLVELPHLIECIEIKYVIFIGIIII
jgi:ribulose 1,5-bisphosphate synthetase/thiazole synthase